MTIPDGRRAAAFLRSRFTRQDALAFLSAVAFGLLTHLYMLTNKLPNFDDIYCNFTDNRMAFSGRWFLFIPSALSSSLSLPWVNGMISILALSGVCLLIVKLFRVKRTFCILLISALVLSFPVVSDTLAYMFTADAYFLGLLLGVLGVYLTDRYTLGFLPGGVLIALCMGCYQAYMFFCVGLIGMCGILHLLDPAKDNRAVLRLILRFLGALAIASVLYLGVLKIWTLVTGKEIGGYQGAGTMGLSTILQLPKHIYQSYAEYWHCVTRKGEVYFTLYQRILFLLANGGCAGLILLDALYHRKKSILQAVLLCVLVLAFPLIFNGIYLIGANFTYSLMLFSLCLPLVFLLVLYDRFALDTQHAQWFWKRGATLACGYLIAFCFTALAVHQTVHTNQKYALLQMKFDNMFALCNRIVDRVEQMPEFTGDTMVYVEGCADYSNPSYETLKHSEMPLFGNTFATGYHRSYSMLYDGYEFHSFFRDYIGVVYPWPDGERIAAIKETEAFQQMPFFPAKGGVKYIDGVIIVRIGPSGYYMTSKE